MPSAANKRRARFALLGPLTAFLGVASFSSIYAIGCGGTDTIDDSDAGADSQSAETNLEADAADDTTDTSDDTIVVEDAGDSSVLDAADGDATLDVADATLDVGDTTPPTDTKLDAPDATLDATVDGASDAVPDVAPDVIPDVTLDATLDVALDVVLDVTLDVVLDAADAEAATDAFEVGDSSPSAVPSLGAAATFAVLAGSTVTNIGASTVNGNLGVSPGSAIAGFPPGLVVPPFASYTALDGPVVAAQASLTVLYNNLAGAACGTNMTGVSLSGKILSPGVYCFDTSAAMATLDALTLDAKGDPNAFWIFQIGTTLTTPNAASINVINGGSACNVFWQVGSAATIGLANQFAGNIVALASISVNTGSNITGRALARTGGVTLASNQVAFTTCPGSASTDSGLDAPSEAAVDSATDGATDGVTDGG